MNIATLILTNLNKIFPKPKRPCSRTPDPRSLIIATNPVTIDYFERQINSANIKLQNLYHNYVDFKDKVVLDLGCGFGGGTSTYSGMNVKLAIGLEIETTYLFHAKRHIEVKYGGFDKLAFLGADATIIPLKSNSVDIVMANDFMEHVSNPEKAIQEALRVLKEGGYFFFEFPAYYSPRGYHMLYTLYAPWCHVIFSEDTLVKAAKIVAAKENYFWVLHPDWEKYYRCGLNKLTIRRFLNIFISQNDCELEDLYFRSEYRLLQPLVYFGKVNEYLSYVECVLRKRKGSSIGMQEIKNARRKWIKKDWERLKKRLLMRRSNSIGTKHYEDNTNH